MLGAKLSSKTGIPVIHVPHTLSLNNNAWSGNVTHPAGWDSIINTISTLDIVILDHSCTCLNAQRAVQNFSKKIVVLCTLPDYISAYERLREMSSKYGPQLPTNKDTYHTPRARYIADFITTMNPDFVLGQWDYTVDNLVTKIESLIIAE